MKQFTNKVVLVTGGNSGIGLAAALRFQEEGARVIVTARTNATYEKAAKEWGSRLHVIQADVSKKEDIQRLMTSIEVEHGKLDVVFANAGISIIKPTHEFDDESFDLLFNTNVKSIFYTIKYAMPILNPGSSVVLNASQAAHLGYSGASLYGATKGALLSLVRHWAAEFKERRIRFNSVSPGLIETPIISKSGLTNEGVEFFREIGKRNPLGRLGEADEVANAVLYLASAQSSYINATDLSIDGGGQAVPSVN